MSEPDRFYESSESFTFSTIQVEVEPLWSSDPSVVVCVSDTSVSGPRIHFTDPKTLRHAAQALLEHADWLEAEQAKEPTP